jgi:hypothetical protein
MQGGGRLPMSRFAGVLNLFGHSFRAGWMIPVPRMASTWMSNDDAGKSGRVHFGFSKVINALARWLLFD